MLKGKPFPDVERPEDEFSGRVTLRMSKSLHRCVHEKAMSDAVSLNQWIVEAIASRSDRRMVPADSVLVASRGRAAAGGTQMMFLQTHHLATIQMDTKEVNVFGVPGVHESMTQLHPLMVSTNAAGRITYG